MIARLSATLQPSRIDELSFHLYLNLKLSLPFSSAHNSQAANVQLVKSYHTLDPKLGDMPESVFAVVSSRVSRLLHQLVYSFPTPNRTISAQSAADPSIGMQLPNAKHGAEDLLSEPGESRALAGGIGPLSFAGSGYGIMLVIMVRCQV